MAEERERLTPEEESALRKFWEEIGTEKARLILENAASRAKQMLGSPKHPDAETPLLR